MRKSIHTRLVFLLAGLTMFTTIIFWAMNRFGLPKYYEKTKINTIGSIYNMTDQICRDVDWSEQLSSDSDIYKELDALGANNGASIYIFQLIPAVPSWGYSPLYPVMNDMQKKELEKRLSQFIYSTDNGQSLTVLKERTDFNIYKLFDERMQSNYIELFGSFQTDYFIYVRSNYQSITESSKIINKFTLYVGITVTLTGILLMFFISRRFTRPILQLAGHAKKMAALDFNEKYNGQRDDEVGILGTSMNVLSTELEKTISELKTANNELQLDIERKEKQDEMRREFLANVSHELKTPIALIQGYAEGLQDNINDDTESKEFYCDVIVDEANKMNIMVKRLLDLNQLEFGTNTVSFERFNIVETIQSVLNSTAILFEQKGVELRFTQPEPIFVWADDYMIEEVVTNYVNNALNHVSGDNCIEIKVVAKESTVRISIFNTGTAIPEDEIENIWKKFYKVDKARTREYGGNGIGLSIVKAIMESHNQKYGVINYSNGVEFYFELDTKM